MEPLISFRSSIDKLNDEEFKIFRNKWLLMLDRDLISSTIFNYFRFNLFHDKTYNLENTMDIINNIISSRKKSSKLIKKRNKKLSELPSSLIGEISSFLKESDHSNFQISCRQIYISCNKPSKLIYLQRSGTNGLYGDVRNKYPLLNKLKIGIGILNISMSSYSKTNHRFNHLNTLILNGGHSHRMTTDIEQFLQKNNLINFDNINDLQCNSFKSWNITGNAINYDLDINIFYKFLSHFPNLHGLVLNDMPLNNMDDDDDDDDDDDILSKLLPKLTCFAALRNTNSMLSNKIINLYGHQLESLCIVGQDSSNIDSTKYGFKKLKDLSIASPSIKTINNILNTTNVLQRFGIGCTQQNIEELHNVLIQLIKTQKLLEYIGFDVSFNDWNKMINIISNVLLQTKDIDKNEFKFKFNWIDCDEITIQEIDSNILSLGKQLNQSNIKNFMLDNTFYLRDGVEINIDDEKRKTMKIFDNLFVAHYEFDKKYHRFIISNKHCTICGYHVRWIHSY